MLGERRNVSKLLFWVPGCRVSRNISEVLFQVPGCRVFRLSRRFETHCNKLIKVSPLLGREFQFQNRIILLSANMVPPLLLLSLTRTIVGEELVLFGERGVQPILRRFGIPP